MKSDLAAAAVRAVPDQAKKDVVAAAVRRPKRSEAGRRGRSSAGRSG
jgi:hypothetical protein